MVPANRNRMSLYQEAKASLKSLIQQTAQVFVGFVIMLLVTGGNPSGLVVGLSFCLGVGFVAWSEKNRLESSTKNTTRLEPETSIKSADSFEIPKEVATQDSKINLYWSDIETLLQTLLPQNISRTKQTVLKIKFSLSSKSESFQNPQNLIQRVVEADTNNFLELAKIAGLDARTDLAGTDLRGFDLSRANLSDANLSRADLSRANLSRADLSNANLSRAFLSRANLSYTNLFRANLFRANLSRTDLSDTDLSSAILSGVNLRNTIINAKTKIDSKWRIVWEIVNQGAAGRDLSGADLSGADLSGADLSDANLSDANLSYAILSRADLIAANLIGADLSGANVKNAQFAYNAGIDLVMKRDLIARGAIFEDSTGDRSGVLVGV